MSLSKKREEEIEEEIEWLRENETEDYFVIQKYADEVFDVMAEIPDDIYEPLFIREVQEKGASISMKRARYLISGLKTMGYTKEDFVTPDLDAEEAEKYAEEFYMPDTDNYNDLLDDGEDEELSDMEKARRKAFRKYCNE